MTITIQWWYISIALFFIPIIYQIFRKPKGDYDFGIDILLVMLICWSIATGLIIGKLL